MVYFESGRLVHSSTGRESGMDGLVTLLGWGSGDFEFSPGSVAPAVSIRMPVTHALMEAVRRRDEHAGVTPMPRNESEVEMSEPSRDSSAVLEDLLRVPGVEAVVVVGRDGFVIESTGNTRRVDVDPLGAAVAHAINAVEEMGSELEIQAFRDLFIEYGQAVILCRPCGDAIVCLLAPDASKLGIIRHKAGRFFPELAQFF